MMLMGCQHQKDLADALKTSPSTITNVASGRAGPTITEAYLLILELAKEVPPDRLKVVLNSRASVGR